jgi:predicted ester cyclase
VVNSNPRRNDLGDALRVACDTLRNVWEFRELGRMYDHYTHRANIIQGGQLTYGRDAWLERVTQQLTCFPDARLFIDEVFACEDESGNFRVALRCTFVGTHLGHGVYGTPTGQRIVQPWLLLLRVADECIAEEWRAVDEVGLLRQLGWSDEAIRQAPPWGFSALEAPEVQGEIERLQGQLPPDPGNARENFEIGSFLRSTLHRLWNRRMVGRSDAGVDHYFRGHGNSRGERYGAQDFQEDALGWLAMFPDLAHHIDDLIWVGGSREGFRAMLRWTWLGTHDGHGWLGAPTGRRVRVSGLSLLYVRNRRLTEGWTEFGEHTLWHTLAPSPAPVEPDAAE